MSPADTAKPRPGPPATDAASAAPDVDAMQGSADQAISRLLKAGRALATAVWTGQPQYCSWDYNTTPADRPGPASCKALSDNRRLASGRET